MKQYELATDFMFADATASSYDLMIGSFDGAFSQTVIVQKANYNPIKPSASNKYYPTTISYDEPLVVTFQVCKNICNTDNMIISPDEASVITRWLGREDGYHHLKLFQDGYNDIFFNGAFTSISEVFKNGYHVGYELEFTTDSPYAYMDEVSINYTSDNPNNTEFDFDVFSDVIGVIYPTVIVRPLFNFDGLPLTFYNDRYEDINNDSTEFKKITLAQTKRYINMNGENKIIEALDDTCKGFNYNFYYLVTSYDNHKNSFKANYPCEVTIKYNPIRKVALR